jgi:hypothetical protein
MRHTDRASELGLTYRGEGDHGFARFTLSG